MQRYKGAATWHVGCAEKSVNVEIVSQWHYQDRKLDQSEKRVRGIPLQLLTVTMGNATLGGRNNIYLCLWHNGSVQSGHLGDSFYTSEVYILHMYEAQCGGGAKPPICPDWIRFCLYFYFLWINLKRLLLLLRNRKIRNHFASFSWGLVNMSVGLASTHFQWHYPFIRKIFQYNSSLVPDDYQLFS
jgi:hypothetical protein